MKTYSVEQAIQAQKALRHAAGLGPEMFPIQAFVGMISDEIQELRSLHHAPFVDVEARNDAARQRH